MDSPIDLHAARIAALLPRVVGQARLDVSAHLTSLTVVSPEHDPAVEPA